MVHICTRIVLVEAGQFVLIGFLVLGVLMQVQWRLCWSWSNYGCLGLLLFLESSHGSLWHNVHVFSLLKPEFVSGDLGHLVLFLVDVAVDEVDQAQGQSNDHHDTNNQGVLNGVLFGIDEVFNGLFGREGVLTTCCNIPINNLGRGCLLF